MLWISLLFACRSDVKESETDSGEVEQTYVDADGDGYTEENDCDDISSINPQAEEVCDDIDNNCNGEIDDGVGDMYYTDADGDGFGDPDAMVQCVMHPPRFWYCGKCR